MFEKKGFTLIELLGVIILLGILALIAYPIINNTIRNSQQEALEKTISNIEDAAYKYSIENDLGYKRMYDKMELSVLKESGFLKDEPIINPVTDEEMKGCVIYRWKKDLKQYEFYYDEECIVPIPEINITFAVLNDAINNEGWADEEFYVRVTAENALNYRWCTTTGSECEPIAFVDGETNTVLINNQSQTNKICVIAKNYNEEEQDIVCSDNFKLDKDGPTISPITTYYVAATPGADLEAIGYFNYDVGAGIAKDITCNVNGVVTNNISRLSTGDHTLECTVTKQNGKSATASISLGITNCFTFNTTNKTITNYNCYLGNPAGYTTDTSVTIPYSINQVNVESIGSGSNTNLSFRNKGITSVDFSQAIPLKTIGSYAFYANQITSVVLPKNVETINSYAFYNNRISSLTLNDKLTSINNNAFYSNQLTTVSLPNSLKTIGSESFRNNQLKNITIPNNVTTLGSYAFAYNNLADVKIGNSLETIGSRAFYSNLLPTVTIPSNIKTIGSYAFSNNKLTNINFNNGLVTINERAFANNQLPSVTLPSTLKTIGDFAFYTNKLESIVIPSSVTSIEDAAFNNNKLPDSQATVYARNTDGSINNTKVVSYGGSNKTPIIPSHVNTLGDYSYSYNQLTTVTIPTSVTSMGSYAFYSNSLPTVTIPNSVTNMGSYAFASNRLTSVTISTGLTALSSNVFTNNQLPNVTIPSSIVSIGSYAFQNNYLTEITIPNKVKTIGSYAFQSNRLASITIPTSVTSIGHAAFNTNQLPDSQATIYARNADGSINNTKIVSYGGSNKTPIIANSVTTLGTYSFYSNQLTAVTIPESVTSIESYAFNNNRLTSISIPNNVTTITAWSFASNRLTTVTIPNKVTSIGSYAFYSNSLTNATLSNSLTSIENYAFYSNQLTTIAIPKSVTSISSYAFNSNSTLKTIDVDNTYKAISNAPWGASNATVNWLQSVLVNITLPEGVSLSDNCKYSGKYYSECIETITFNDKKVISFKLNGVTMTGSTFTVPAQDVTISDVINENIYVVESEHPYQNSINETYTKTITGANNLILQFNSSTEFESNCDYLYIYDKNGNLIGTFTGTRLKNGRITVPGDSVRLVLTSDSSVTYYGFYVEITPN